MPVRGQGMALSVQPQQFPLPCCPFAASTMRLFQSQTPPGAQDRMTRRNVALGLNLEGVHHVGLCLRHDHPQGTLGPRDLRTCRWMSRRKARLMMITCPRRRAKMPKPGNVPAQLD